MSHRLAAAIAAVSVLALCVASRQADGVVVFTGARQYVQVGDFDADYGDDFADLDEALDFHAYVESTSVYGSWAEAMFTSTFQGYPHFPAFHAFSGGTAHSWVDPLTDQIIGQPWTEAYARVDFTVLDEPVSWALSADIVAEGGMTSGYLWLEGWSRPPTYPTEHVHFVDESIDYYGDGIVCDGAGILQPDFDYRLTFHVWALAYPAAWHQAEVQLTLMSIPEPSAVMILPAGLIGFVVARRIARTRKVRGRA